MKNIFKVTLLSTAFLVSACDNANSMSEAEVEKIVEKYIKENPQVIIDSLNKMQEDAAAEKEKAAKEYLEKNYDSIVNDKSSAVFGNKDGKKVVVEYFDYNCGYCKRVFPTLVELTKDPEVKVVLKELPVLGPSSELAARFAVVVQLKAPEKYLEFHAKLMDHKGKKTPDSLLQIVEEIGIKDIDFEKEVQSEEVVKTITKNHEEASGLTISGTPGFIIDKQIIRGAVDIKTMKNILK